MEVCIVKDIIYKKVVHNEARTGKETERGSLDVYAPCKVGGRLSDMSNLEASSSTSI